MAITAQMVKELRELTGAGMMDCKKALSETDGDQEKAIMYLREKGLSKAAKKAGRATSEGFVGSSVTDKVAVMVELQSETDFVAKNEAFQSFANGLAEKIAAAAPKGELPAELADVSSLIATLGENMQVGKFVRFELAKTGCYGCYIHSTGKLGVLVELETEAGCAPEVQELARDIAMQVAAMPPVCLCPADLPQDKLEQEKALYLKQAMDEGKPEAIAEKIVLGRVNKYYKEVCLTEQQFIKDDKKTISGVIKDVAKKVGKDIAITRYHRLAVGEA